MFIPNVSPKVADLIVSKIIKFYRISTVFDIYSLADENKCPKIVFSMTLQKRTKSYTNRLLAKILFWTVLSMPIPRKDFELKISLEYFSDLIC